MNTIKTIVRFGLILVFLILLVFLSVFLFKLIPKGINQLATASLSITGLEKEATTTPSIEDRIPQPVATTTGGLNGVIQNPNTQSGGITILDSKPTNVKKVYTNTAPKTVYYPVYTRSGLKNIKVTLISTGIIDRYSGQFVSTNSFNTNDVVSIKFKIENDQDTDTGIFSIKVDMPAANYNDKVRYQTMSISGNTAYQVEARFDGIDRNIDPTVRIYADYGSQVAETNESDNILSVTLNNINNNYNNCYYSNGYYYNCGSNYNNNNNCYYSNGYLVCNNNYNNNYDSNLQIISVEPGKMVNNEFSSQTNFVYGDRVALKVRVRNTGGSFSQTWSTRATYSDTTGSNRYVTIDNERGMNNGEERVLIIQTNSTLNRGTTLFNVSVDSNNTIYETNEGDNNASVNIYTY